MTPHLWGGGGVKTGSVCHFAFFLVLQCLGVPKQPDAWKNSTKSVIVTRLLCAPNAGKNYDLREVSPYASRQSTGRMTNRTHFAHWCAPAAPPPELHSGASNCAPELAFAFMALRANFWICYPPLPYLPCKNRTHSIYFSARGGTRRLLHPRPWSFGNSGIRKGGGQNVIVSWVGGGAKPFLGRGFMVCFPLPWVPPLCFSLKVADFCPLSCVKLVPTLSIF